MSTRARYSNSRTTPRMPLTDIPAPNAQTGDQAAAARPQKALWRILCRTRSPETILTVDSKPGDKPLKAVRTAIKPDEAPLDTHLIEDSATQSQNAQEEGQDWRDKSSELSQIIANPSLMLSGEQKAVLHAVLQGNQNIFFTGAAGTGKSVLLRCTIAHLRQRYKRDEVAVTAMTGIAACNIGGTTLHRFAGIGLGQDSAEALIKQIHRNRRSLQRWQRVKILLIDEVSMLRSDLLEKLEAIARGVRGNNIKFGGIQLVFTGDLFQLPPIPDRYGPGANSQAEYCFESPLWTNLIDRTVNLTRVFRQADPTFAGVLNDLRVGRVSEDTAELFRSLVRPPKMPKGIVPTKLFPRRKDVTVANQQALGRLEGTLYEYDCYDVLTEAGQREKINMNLVSMAEERVQLKLGAQVMMIKNIDDTIVNGSIGKIVAFMSADDMGIKERQYDGGSDGEIDSGYSAELLGAYGDSKSAQRKRSFANALSEAQSNAKVVWPVVRFATREGTIRYMMVRPETWSVTDSNEATIASRTQLPLLLAWALSIHKAQGQTLPYVSVNLEHIFEKGQAYVAISRATCIEGLQIHRFNQRAVMVDHRVLSFYQNMEKVSEHEIAGAEAYFRAEERTTKSTKKVSSTSVGATDADADAAGAAAAPAPRRKAVKSRKRQASGNTDSFAEAESYSKAAEETPRPESSAYSAAAAASAASAAASAAAAPPWWNAESDVHTDIPVANGTPSDAVPVKESPNIEGRGGNRRQRVVPNYDDIPLGTQDYSSQDPMWVPKFDSSTPMFTPEDVSAFGSVLHTDDVVDLPASKRYHHPEHNQAPR